MKWYKENLDLSSSILGLEGAEIYKNDENLKPSWVEAPVVNSEFHIKRNKDNILVVIGESWTYGESLGNIATGLKKYDLLSQLQYCFGVKMSITLNFDYFQYAVPGNCNANMYIELPRILKYITANFNYKNIFLVTQLTEPSRESAILNELPKHPVTALYKNKKPIKFEDWLLRYDEVFLDIISEEVEKYKNIKTVVWKNFCKFLNKKIYNNLQLIETSWIEYSAKFLGKQYETLSFQSIRWLDSIMKESNKNNIQFDISWISDEINKIEKSNEFISNNFLHNNHPNEIAHILWAQYLLLETGWQNE